MLDPTRLKLSAESVGYQARFGRPIEWAQFDKALQTDYNNQGSAIQVRREKETPHDEIRVMGAQQSGFESNSLLLTNDRQARQINGYPLRQFSAENPAVVVPKKYGGLPMYTRNQTEYDQYVSRFTEPLSAQLDSQTALLSRAGMPALTEDIARPYEAAQFLNPMTSTKDELDQNDNVFKQRMHLQKMSAAQNFNKRKNTPNDSSYNMFYNAKKQNILVSKEGVPVSNARDAIDSERAVTDLFENEGQDQYAQRQLRNLVHDPEEHTGGLFAFGSSDIGYAPSVLNRGGVTPAKRVDFSQTTYSTPEDEEGQQVVAGYYKLSSSPFHNQFGELRERNLALQEKGAAVQTMKRIAQSESKISRAEYMNGVPERSVITSSGTKLKMPSYLPPSPTTRADRLFSPLHDTKAGKYRKIRSEVDQSNILITPEKFRGRKKK